jgi:DNA polymerase elongation subunit (family B)
MYKNVYVSSRTEYQESLVYVWDDSIEENGGLVTAPYREFSYGYRKDIHGVFTSMFGEKLAKVKNPRWGEPGLYESDLPRETRVLTDLYLDSDLPSTGHKVRCIDIETDSEGGYGDPMQGDKAITSISHYDYATDTRAVYILDTAGHLEASVEGNTTVLPFKTESELLDAYMAYHTANYPTIVTGWNTDGYDIPYLFNRLKRVKGEYVANSLSPVGIVEWNKYKGRYIIAGVSSLDYLQLYKKFTYSQKPSYRLDAIAKDEVGRGKTEYEGNLDMLFKSDIKLFIAYNLNDVDLVVDIDKKMKLIELVRFICHIGHVPYEDCYASSKFIEGTIITYLHRKGLIAPNKPEGGKEAFDALKEEVGFDGAYVKPPFPGLYEWVYSLDLQSLYPSIIMSLNISPDTKSGKVFEFSVDDFANKVDRKYEVQFKGGNGVFTRDQLKTFLTEHEYIVSSNGILYSSKRTGIIPEILDTWFKERVEYKNLMKKYVKEGDAEKADFYDRRQHVQKILLNSIYGVLGLPIFRFYDLDNALAVTATGQDVIKTTAKYVNHQYKVKGAAPKTETWCEQYHDILLHDDPKAEASNPTDHCIYIDTDSVYFSAMPVMQGDDPKAFTITLARDMEAGVNKFYDAMARNLFNCQSHRFVIKGESVMQTGFWVAKKRYVMYKVYDLETNKDMEKISAKGLDVVRSSFPKRFGALMNDVLGAILKKKTKKELDDIILTFRKALKDVPYIEIVRNIGISNISKHEDKKEERLNVFPSGAPAHVKAAITYNRLLKRMGLDKKHAPIKSGDKIKWTPLRMNPFRIETLAFKTYDDPQEIMDLVTEYIDHDALFEAELAKKLQNFYDAMNWGLIPTKVNQAAAKFFTFK